MTLAPKEAEAELSAWIRLARETATATKTKIRAGELAQKLRVLAALIDHRGSIPNTRMVAHRYL